MLFKLVEDATRRRRADPCRGDLRLFRQDLPQRDLSRTTRPSARRRPRICVPQFPLTRDATRAFNIACIEQRGITRPTTSSPRLSCRARDAGGRVTIVSSDKDLMQLVGDGVEMFDPMKNKRIGRDEVLREVRRLPRPGGRRAGAGRRFGRQRAGRAGDRDQDRGAADQRIRRSGHAAGARRRDQAAEAARGAGRECRADPDLASGWCTLDCDMPLDVALDELEVQRPRCRGAAAVPGRDGVPHAVQADRRQAGRRRARRSPTPRPDGADPETPSRAGRAAADRPGGL